MAKTKDLTGMKFGRLTVVERSSNDKHGKTQWLCKCDCGNEKVIRGDSLRGGTISCGCYNMEKISKPRLDLTGKKFGKLTVIDKANEKGYWNCVCECGNTKKVSASNLQRGATRSCGCLLKENSKEMMIELTEKQRHDEEYKQRRNKKIKQSWQDEERRKNMSEQAKQRTGEKNPNYKGGITPIAFHLRHCTKQWDKNVRLHCNGQCVLTGKKCNTRNSTVHHLYGFNMIVQEAHVINNIEIKPQVKDYTKEELQILENYVLGWHKDISNGVLLCNEIHKLFHSLYGKGNNTSYQFEEFKQRYLNGEFNKSDSNSNVA